MAVVPENEPAHYKNIQYKPSLIKSESAVSLGHVPSPSCVICNLSVSTQDILKIHTKDQHHKGDVWYCHCCAKPFKSRADLIKHHSDEHDCSPCAENILRRCLLRINGKNKCEDCKCAEKARRAPSAFGCGFCGGLVSGRDTWFKHINQCGRNPATLSLWDFSLELRALIYYHPELNKAFRTIVQASGHPPGALLEWQENYRAEELLKDLQFWGYNKDRAKMLATEALNMHMTNCNCNVSIPLSSITGRDGRTAQTTMKMTPAVFDTNTLSLPTQAQGYYAKRRSPASEYLVFQGQGILQDGFQNEITSTDNLSDSTSDWSPKSQSIMHRSTKPGNQPVSEIMDIFLNSSMIDSGEDHMQFIIT
ncbi:hypothetical protein CC78DRAFT_598823 [Lojkania enalia]|uniref:C2H2-type domain-containing protein n=1 Tax=Lojkania enalia TaxID=147567 RepID=A0A9P4N726_9PLEO|nr:hypothetical protein CC78DRAFT_598823 [Didymosphaeria enalia]